MANKRRIILYIISFSLAFIIAFSEVITYLTHTNETNIGKCVQLLKAVAYIMFIAIYSFYFKSKQNDKRILKGSMFVFILLIFWNIFKIVRWNTNDDFSAEIMWYLYYIPIIFIPISYFYLFISLSFFHSIKKRIVVFSILITGILLALLVLTNHWHNYVFKIGIDDYTYNFGYYIVVGFITAVVIASFALAILSALRQKAATKKGLIALFTETALIILFYILYFFKVTKDLPVIDDITAITTIYLLLLNNTMIYAGLLPVSLEHRNIFYKSNLRLVLTDDNGNIFDKTKSLSNIDKNIIDTMKDKNSIMDDTILITKKKILNGYIYSEKDLTSIIQLKNNIEENKKNLEERLKLKIKSKELSESIIKEKYRNEVYAIFNSMVKELTKDIKFIEETREDDQLKLKQISLILIYLKRTCIFSVFKDANELRPADDLTLALHEVIEYLKKMDINCNILFYEKELTNKNVLDIYTGLYSLIFLAIKNNYKDLFIRINKKNNIFEIIMSIEGANYIEGLDNQIIDDTTLIVKKVIA